MKKLNQKEVECRVRKKGLKLIGLYKGQCNKTQFQCHCGNVFYGDPKSVFNGCITSCGCLGHKKLDDNKVADRYKTYGLELLEVYKNNTSRVKTKCHCGNIFYSMPLNVFAGDSQSCGCRHELAGKFHKDWKGCGDISGAYWCWMRRAARDRNLEFDISIEYANDILEKQKYKCSLSGVPIGFGKYNKNNTASLDRINPKVGYIEGNVQWVHKTINAMKYSFITERFLELCKLVNSPIYDDGSVYPEFKPHGNWGGCGIISATHWSQVKRMAAKRNISFGLTLKDAWNLFLAQNGRCTLTGIILDRHTLSLDRIDSKSYYVLNNVRWVHKDINHMKWALTDIEFKNWCKLACEQLY